MWPPTRSLATFVVLLPLLSACSAGDQGGIEEPAEPAAESSAVATPVSGPFHFVDVASATGLGFQHESGMFGENYFVEIFGPGGALLDYDNDGDLDIYIVQGFPLEPLTRGEANQTVSDRLYQNRLEETGQLGFVDVTESSGIRAFGYGIGVAAGDYDNDGFADLYVTNWGDNQLWKNNRDGTFRDVTAEAGVNDPRFSTSAAFGDLDGDGHLDLYVANYNRYSLANNRQCHADSGRLSWCGPDTYAADLDSVFLNRGNGTFEDVSFASGTAAATPGAGLGVVILDLNDDGYRDVLVTNDGSENHLWLGQGNGQFREDALLAGLAVNAAGMSEASMGVAVGDFDGDADEDIFITHLAKETNTLYRNLGGGLFADETVSMGLGTPSWSYTGFGTSAADFDKDGWLDLFVANGDVALIEEQAAAGDPLPLRQSDQFFHNTGGGVFIETTDRTLPPLLKHHVGRGTASGDIDNDGDVDLLVLNMQGPARLLRNETEPGRGWLGLRLLGTGGKRDMLGARVWLSRPGTSPLIRRVATDGSYASSNDPRVLFGLGPATAFPLDVRVEWPSGRVEDFPGLQGNRYHTLTEGSGTEGSS